MKFVEVEGICFVYGRNAYKILVGKSEKKETTLRTWVEMGG
jgi:hypothetical protein